MASQHEVEMDAVLGPPAWITDSPLLARAYSLAESAHRSQRRLTDGRPFLDHAVEVATFLHEAAFDDELIAVGLLHDAVERGTLSEEELRSEMGESIATLVLTLTEDDTIDSFEERKAALRNQVREGGGLAVTVFAADKLSDIVGLRRGLQRFGDVVEDRMGTRSPAWPATTANRSSSSNRPGPDRPSCRRFACSWIAWRPRRPPRRGLALDGLLARPPHVDRERRRTRVHPQRPL